MHWLVRAGRRLDDRLYPSYREQEVTPPVFISAIPRSGTTYLHRLMSVDSDTFAHYRLFQTLFPAISLYKALDRLGGFDERLHGKLAKLQQMLDRRAFSGWGDIHPTGFLEPEEDEMVFLYTLMSPALYLLVPFIDELPQLGHVDHLSRSERERLARYYRDSVKRHLFAMGGNRRLLNKNVFLAGRLSTVMDAFPNTQVIHLVRHPYQAIPSLLSMFYAAWSTHSPGIARNSPEVRALAQLGIDYYRHLEAQRNRLPAEQFVTVRYRSLVDKPVETVERIYRHFGFDLTRIYAQRLREEAVRGREFRSRHKYSLDEFGLTKEFIYDELRESFEIHGFER
jgi:hypothetical protein